jgi:inner membrane protein
VFFWHIGATIAFVRYAFRDEAMDLRYLALGAILPDLIDMPVAVPMWTSWEAPRLVGHSLLFGSIIMVAVLIGTSRGIRRKRWILLSVGVLMHLALDAMWADPSTLWWPFLGWEFTSTGIGTFPEYASDILSDPWMWAGEAAGLAYLVHLWRSSDLDDPTARGVFLSTGRVSAPIDRK